MYGKGFKKVLDSTICAYTLINNTVSLVCCVSELSQRITSLSCSLQAVSCVRWYPVVLRRWMSP